MAAKQGDRSEIQKLSVFFEEICEILKEMISVYKRGIPHKVKHIDDDGNDALIEVNTNEDNELFNVFRKCFFKVELEDNVEQMLAEKHNEAITRLQLGLSTPTRTLLDLDPPEVHQRIEELKQYNETLALNEILQQLPDEQKQQIFQAMQAMAQQQDNAQPGRQQGDQRQKTATNPDTQAAGMNDIQNEVSKVMSAQQSVAIQ